MLTVEQTKAVFMAFLISLESLEFNYIKGDSTYCEISTTSMSGADIERFREFVYRLEDEIELPLLCIANKRADNGLTIKINEKTPILQPAG